MRVLAQGVSTVHIVGWDRAGGVVHAQMSSVRKSAALGDKRIDALPDNNGHTKHVAPDPCPRGAQQPLRKRSGSRSLSRREA